MYKTQNVVFSITYISFTNAVFSKFSGNQILQERLQIHEMIRNRTMKSINKNNWNFNKGKNRLKWKFMEMLCWFKNGKCEFDFKNYTTDDDCK